MFIGHGVIFINDSLPTCGEPGRQPQSKDDWQVVLTVVRKNASLGSGSTILCGIEIGEAAIVGAGSVVTRNVPPAPSSRETRRGSCSRIEGK